MDDTPTPIAEIDHGPSKLDIFLEENQKLLMGSAIAIFLGVVGYVGYTGYQDMVNANAGEALAASNTETEIQSVISQHPGTPSAASAKLMLANLKAAESSEAAISALNDFTTSFPEHPAIASATTSLGLRLLNEGKLAEAEAKLNSVLDMENADYIKPAAQIALGDIAKLNNDLPRAKDLYNNVTNLVTDADDAEFSANVAKFAPYKAIAAARLRFLEASLPTDIVAPKPTAKPAALPVPPVPASSAAPVTPTTATTQVKSPQPDNSSTTEEKTKQTPVPQSNNN